MGDRAWTTHEQKKARNVGIAIFGAALAIWGAAIDRWPIVVVGGLIPIAVLVKGLWFHIGKSECGHTYTGAEQQ
ncbi:MAG: hypothetical protein AAB955_01115 [Patescibacteria group bacterium]